MSNYNLTLQSNNTDLQAILNTINELPEAGGEQATPVISVNSTNGLITATAGTKTSTHQLAFQPAKTITPSTTSQIAVSSGYYTGGDIIVEGINGSIAHITPKATQQIIVASGGYYFTDIFVEGDSNLIAGNIKKGVDIFGVSGTLEEGGMSSGEQVEWSANEDAIIAGTISGSYFNDRVTSICSNAFQNCTNLTTVSFPVCEIINSSAFQNCTNLTTVSFPVCKAIYYHAFQNCTNLTTVSFPACTNVYFYAFQNCTNLTTVSFPVCTVIFSYAFAKCSNLTAVSFPTCETICKSAFRDCMKLATVSFPACERIEDNAFSKCYNLKSLYLTGSSLCMLSNSNVFIFTPIGGYSASAGTYGSIYVPASLLTSYQTATNWTYFSSRFVGI